GLHGEECHRHQQIERLQHVVNGHPALEGYTAESHPMTDGILRDAVAPDEVCDQRLNESVDLVHLGCAPLTLLAEQQHALSPVSPAYGKVCRLLLKQRAHEGFERVDPWIGRASVYPIGR